MTDRSLVARVLMRDAVNSGVACVNRDGESLLGRGVWAVACRPMCSEIIEWTESYKPAVWCQRWGWTLAPDEALMAVRQVSDPATVLLGIVRLVRSTSDAVELCERLGGGTIYRLDTGTVLAVTNRLELGLAT